MTVTEDQITAALHEHAEQVGDRWSFTGPLQTEAAARAIVEACLLLGTRITDVATAEMWLALVRRVVALEEPELADWEKEVILRQPSLEHRPTGEERIRAATKAALPEVNTNNWSVNACEAWLRDVLCGPNSDEATTP